MKRIVVATMVATFAAGGLAFASGPEEAGDRNERREARAQWMEQIDGADLETFTGLMRERAGERFDAMDANGDGTITREEFLAASGQRFETMFDRMGPDADGIVTRADRQGWGRHARGGPRAMMRGMSSEDRAERIGQRAAEEFARLDTDGDGVISLEEFEAGMQARAERFSERRQARAEASERGGWRGGHRMRARSSPQFEVPEELRELREQMRSMMREGMDLDGFSDHMRQRTESRFDRLDADGDGVLTREEFLAAAESRAGEVFARMDRNEDGVLTRSDRPRMGGMRQRHGGRK